MTITTEEAEALANHLEGAKGLFEGIATALRTLAAERDIANEQIYGLAEEREKWKERAEAAERRLFDAFRAQGKAEGKLAASEMAGVVRGWKERAESAEAEAERLREALKPFADIAEAYDPPEGDDDDTAWDRRHTPTIGMLRRARVALEGGDNADQPNEKSPDR